MGVTVESAITAIPEVKSHQMRMLYLDCKRRTALAARALARPQAAQAIAHRLQALARNQQDLRGSGATQVH